MFIKCRRRPGAPQRAMKSKEQKERKQNPVGPRRGVGTGAAALSQPWAQKQGKSVGTMMTRSQSQKGGHLDPPLP